MGAGDTTFTLDSQNLSSVQSPLFGLGSGCYWFHVFFVDIVFMLIESGQQKVETEVILRFYLNTNYVNG